MKSQINNQKKIKIEVPDAVYENLLRIIIKSAVKEKNKPSLRYSENELRKF